MVRNWEMVMLESDMDPFLSSARWQLITFRSLDSSFYSGLHRKWKGKSRLYLVWSQILRSAMDLVTYSFEAAQFRLRPEALTMLTSIREGPKQELFSEPDALVGACDVVRSKWLVFKQVTCFETEICFEISIALAVARFLLSEFPLSSTIWTDWEWPISCERW